MDVFDADGYWLVRSLFERAVAAIYLVAFVNARNQFPALLGENGLTPIGRVLEPTDFRSKPTIFHWHYSDGFLHVVAWTGIVLSAAALLGVPSSGPIWLHVAWWLVLWMLYLSIVNAGGRFYGFGWESMTLEAGFFTAFMGPSHVEPSIIPIILIRWLLFRVEVGAGLIKMRNDPCWRDLTCLYYHYETQPLPNPLSRRFHDLPESVHRASVLFSHFTQLIVPFGLFAPQPIAAVAGALIVFHQLMLIVSGNYAWLNWLTVVLAIPAFSDPVLGFAGPEAALNERPAVYEFLLIGLGLMTLALSVKPTLNFFSRHQRMNFSYNPVHLVSTYGAFGSVTKKRYEVVIEGTDDPSPSEASEWVEYEFKAKPGNPSRTSPQVAPYHLRIDWMMWFLPLSVGVTPNGIVVPGYETWFVRLLSKLLHGDRAVRKLLRTDPFSDHPPEYVRVRFYHYEFSDNAEKRQTGRWWTRRLLGEYLGPVSRENLES